MAKLRIKPGVDMGGIRSEATVALMVVFNILAPHTTEVVVTSCKDGRHSRGSLHYKGLALDIRTNNLQADDQQKRLLRDEIRACLGVQFDVILEDLGGANEHLHVEFDPK